MTLVASKTSKLDMTYRRDGPSISRMVLDFRSILSYCVTVAAGQAAREHEDV